MPVADISIAADMPVTGISFEGWFRRQARLRTGRHRADGRRIARRSSRLRPESLCRIVPP
jgi:hypothetical protein